MIKEKLAKIKLTKELGLLDVFCIASGAMVSSGLFILPGIATAQVGPALFVSYFLAGLLAMTGMLSQAELVSAMPKAGGTYFYVTRSMGPGVGTVDGLLTWFALSLKSAFALVGMSAFLTLIVRVDIRLVALILCGLFIGINILGVKEASRVQVVLVIGLLAILVLYIAKGLPAVKVYNFDPFAPHGMAAIFYTAGFVFISYGGLLKVASIAEEVKDPARVVPLAMFLSLLVISVFYVLTVFVTTGVLGSEVLSKSLMPISDGAAVFMGQGGRIALSVAAILAFVTTANAGIMAASRYPLALSRDGLLPEVLMRVNSRFKTPHISIMITGLFMIIALLLNLSVLVKVASTVLILTYMFSCFSVIILRESRLQNYQPQFHAPLYPGVQIIGIVGFAFLLFELGKEAFWISAILIISGFFVFWFYGRIRANREYALLHLIERITAKELTGRTLQTELKEIIRERDDILKDRFDHIIEKCHVLDIEQELSMRDFFKLVADTMSKNLSISAENFYNLLILREKESTTVISEGLAIPHIIIEGEKMFDILLARCRSGITFSGDIPKVHIVFVLVGSRDERNFHLRALSAIAQIVQDTHFENNWKKAKSIEDLRDIVLLGKRQRVA
ncbi:MAG: amino acid permease [Candidatus Omnitrophica bacterium]|nr:amino acid permease [Candidatus Omnitrophota bacterium]MBU1924383.1 amino acid permease [Candidatus Omnitrophota bacterium]